MSDYIIKRGDIVTIGKGKVHWKVVSHTHHRVLLESGMSGRRRYVTDPSTLIIFKTREQVSA